MASKVDVACPGIPEPVGPYSQAIKVDNMLFISGQIGIDPQTGALSSPSIAGQTRTIMQNISALLESLGAGTANIVKTTIYMTSLLDFDMMNEVYAEFFPFCPPARSTVEVQALPKDAMVEIEAIAVLPDTNI